MNNKDLRSAVHECGHAIVCIHLGKKFETIDILRVDVPGGHRGGRIEGIQRKIVNNSLSREESTKHCLISCGGLAADSIFLKKQPIEIAGDPTINVADDDLNQVYEIIKTFLPLSDNQIPEFVDYVMATTFEIVKRKWKQIEILAPHLVARKKLSYEEVIQLIA
jgi:hypothetical protein